MLVWLDCPHCHVRMQTRKLLGPGDMVRCPRCGQLFRLLPDEATLVETFLVADATEQPMSEERPIPRSSYTSVSEQTPVPRTKNPAATPATVPKVAQPSQPLPFVQTRSTIAAVLCMTALGLLGMFLYWYANTVRALDRTATQVGQQRAKALAKLTQPKATRNMTAALAAPDRDRVVAPATLEKGNVVIGVSSAEISPIVVNSRETATLYLVLTLRVTNLSGKPLPFEGWHSAGAAITLRDSLKNYYNSMKFKPDELPRGCLGRVTIQDRETVKDMLVLENPGNLVANPGPMPSPLRNLELDLVLNLRKYEFMIPGGLVRKATALPSTIPVVLAPPDRGSGAGIARYPSTPDTEEGTNPG